MNVPTSNEQNKRNPNLSKWNILFEKDGKQWMTVRPQEGTEVYTCYACREIFGAKSSFVDHVNRYTILLTFRCQLCQGHAELEFHNPCALLLHSRQHYTPYGGLVLLDDITVSCLPEGLIGFPTQPDSSLLYNVREDNVENALNINTRFYSPARANKGKNVIHMAPTILLFYHYKLNGTPPTSLVLKQISSNIPRCIFSKLESNSLSASVVNPLSDKALNQLIHGAQDWNGNNNIINNKQIQQINQANRETNNKQKSDNENKAILTQKNVVTQRQTSILNYIQKSCTENKNLNDKETSEPRTTDNEVQNDNIHTQPKVDNQKPATPPRILNSELSNTNKPLTDNAYDNVVIKEEIDTDFISNTPDPLEMEIDDAGNIPLQVCLDENIGGSTCPECKTQIPYNTCMSLHFANINALTDANQCDICKYVAASPCSLSAHKRLHNRMSPYVCPECGREFEDNMSLLDHIEEVCFHLAKQVRYRCPKKNCCKVFAQLGTFMTHFEVHIQTLNKCKICHVTFYAVRDYLEHVRTEHSLESDDYDIIHKCTICKHSTLFEEHYQRHLKWHCTDKTLRVYVYVCKFCRNFFRSGLTYASHLLRCSKKNLTHEELRRLKKSNAAMVCLHCNYIIRLISNTNNCPKCGKLTNTLKQSTTKKIPENNNITPSTRTIKCILCFEDIIKTEPIKHECKYKYPAVVLTKDDETINKIVNMKCEIPTTQKLDLKKKRRKSFTSPRFLKQKRNNHDSDIQLDDPIPFEGVYSCRICDFKQDDRVSFHEHIKEHRDVSTSYQCMECGECFVVKPSFHKHLQYYHQIGNVDQYVKDNECVDETAIMELKKYMRIESGETSDDVEENQCRVCLKQFEDSVELNKHFRIHGSINAV